MRADKQISSRFHEVFPDSAQPRLWRAPGRVNLIGEHTDYNLGLVCPIALDLACFSASAANPDGILRVYSQNRSELREWPLEAIARCSPTGGWADYVVGVAQQILRLGKTIAPRNLYIESTVPEGSGLSSSAALEVAVALALLDGENLAPLELALLAQRAENEFAGTPCGIMDQYCSVFGEEQAALKIDCRNLSHTGVRLPDSVAILAVNTMVKHELGQSVYGQRVAECAAAVETIQSRHTDVSSLRDTTLEMVTELSAVPEPLERRARHVVSENLRVESFVFAACAGDLQSMGRLFVESHRSLQHDYEVSCEELDFLVDTALSLPGVWGARMTGGGFGGCTMNLVNPAYTAAFRERIAAAYCRRYQTEPQIYECRPSAGAGAIVL